MESVKENYNINYSYTTYLALLMNLRFNRSRKIELEVLKSYPKLLIEALNESEKDCYVTMVIEDDDFEKFLEINKDVLKIDDKYLYLDRRYPMNSLYKVLSLYNYPFTGAAIYDIRFDPELRRSLKLTGIESVFDKHEEFEDSLLSNYISYAMGLDKEECRETIQDSLEKRNGFYGKLMSIDKEFIEDCHAQLSTYDSIYPFENFSPLDKKINYNKKFPIVFNKPDEVLNDIYMFTIFLEYSDSPIYRMYEDVNGLDLKYAQNIDSSDSAEYKKNLAKSFMKDSIAYGKINYTPRTRSQMLFYLKFIKCLEEIMDKYGDIEELRLVKYRLIYLLDSSSLNLLDSDNRFKEYNRLLGQYNYEKQFSLEEIDKYFNEDEDIIRDPIDLYWFQVLIKAFIVDIFESDLYDENLKLKKLAMIKTYYSITEDKEIDKLLNSYSDHPDFWEYRKYITDGVKILKK